MSYACDAAIMSHNLVPFCLTPSSTVRAPVHFSLECIRIQICLGMYGMYLPHIQHVYWLSILLYCILSAYSVYLVFTGGEGGMYLFCGLSQLVLCSLGTLVSPYTASNFQQVLNSQIWINALAQLS